MAIRRSRGVRLFKTLPPIRISPAVGVSRPAIIRKSVVFPEPEGPRKTRNSPSRVSRLTLLTAPRSPCLKTLVRFRVSTTAIEPPYCFHRSLFPPVLLPPGKNALVFLLRGCSRVFRSILPTRHVGKHCGNYVGLECLVNAGARVARIAHVGGPAHHVS